MYVDKNIQSVYVTPKGYYYKILFDQKKKRISKKQFNFLSEFLKKDSYCIVHPQKRLNMKVENCCGLKFLKRISNDSINLILTDPPYMISKNTGMDSLKKGTRNDKKYGRKFAYSTDFGNWDSNFNLAVLEQFAKLFYRKLLFGGTLILWIDIWKISHIKEILENIGFKQIRFLEWIKKNPVPVNSKNNYLNNGREVALCCVKGKKPTFNSSYDVGIYRYTIVSGKKRVHPTQKPLGLFIELIEKHSNPGDVVLDTFLGSGTTLFACLETGRHFNGCELNEQYYQEMNYNLFPDSFSIRNY